MTSDTIAPHQYSAQIIHSIDEVSAHDWDQLSGAAKGSDQAPYNPFISHAFLSALEQSGSATPETGWAPHHIVLSDEGGEIVGALPNYVKSHSQGEYVFDHGWADAFERAGGQYYPKFQACVPFTPATGPRLLARRDQDKKVIASALGDAIIQVTNKIGLSSAHLTFLPESEASILEQHDFLVRLDQQFHFYNDNYQSYDDFLDTLASRKRKALRKERRVALENNIEIDWLTGSDLTEDILDIFYQFYLDTGSRKWGRPYLAREFFSLISQTMRDDILLIMAKRDGRYIAGAINFIGSDCLYGRHWGCVEDHPFLHFEVCYHQAIDYAIEHKLARVEAGAQGQHKLARGYMPATTYSAHYIPHPGFRKAVRDYLVHERQEVENIHDILTDKGPFKIKAPIISEEQP